MPKKILPKKTQPKKKSSNKNIIITGIVILIIIFLAIGKKDNNSQPTPQPSVIQLVPTPLYIKAPLTEESPVLAFNSLPNEISVQSDHNNLDVLLFPHGNEAAGVQLEISYDPNYLTIEEIRPHMYFEGGGNSDILINKIDEVTGHITYAIKFKPDVQPFPFPLTRTKNVEHEFGAAAISIYYKAKKDGQTQISLLPSSLVTIKDIQYPVLKQAIGFNIIISDPK